MNRRFAVRLLLVLMAIASTASIARDDPDTPDLSLNVATRLQEDGRVGEWIHVFRLRCSGEDCELTVLTLNQCTKDTAGAPIVVQRYRSSVGDLRVSRRGDDTLIVEFDHLAGTSRLKIGYDVIPIGDYSRIKVTSFSGGYIYRSGKSGRMTFVEYVPLIGRFNNVSLDCKLELPGVEK